MEIPIANAQISVTYLVAVPQSSSSVSRYGNPLRLEILAQMTTQDKFFSSRP